ncbi:AfsR/SARP family transcriptional regulator [Microlunatus soli]|uniref:AfsR/SARP family transcriptional regulator n=1 Tax=Microlunatus soli TaxID=630515 RepID=UPI0015619179|nr:BTAD domain-containing putative transcriptional regulator [Microlunatus soli]
MLIRVLGPLEVQTPDGWRRIGAPKWRALLARLSLDAHSPVSVDALIDELWGDRPPPGAVNQIHGYVSRIRSLFGDRGRSVLATRSPGYELAVDTDDLDRLSFEHWATRGDGAMRRADHRAAADHYYRALGLWRGAAYTDAATGEAVRREADRLTERQLAVQESRIDADLALGRPAVELVVELEAAVRTHPFREHLHEQLMLSLYRSGRQADALAVYRSVYDRLDDELGVRPGDPLNRLQQQILASDPDLTPSTPGSAPARSSSTAPESTVGSEPAVPRQLPADVADFTGRGSDLAALDDWLESADHGRAPAAIALIAGGGFGKTALALHWAHRVAGRFPDGQLYLNLRGFSGTPALSVDHALASLLHALQVPADQVPNDVDEAAALLRTRLADRRMLIMLDNAADSDQLIPLLPGSGGSRTMITSRDALPRLQARGRAGTHRMNALEPAEGRRLVAMIIGQERAAAEPDAVDQLVRLCAGLPLATRIAAAQLVGHPDLTVADQVAELLGDDHGPPRLTALDLDRDDPEVSVRAAFELSLRRLAPELRRLFCLLSLIPGDTFGPSAAAALTGYEPDIARNRLDQLCARGMLTSTGRLRYGLHDLLRSYASERRTSEIERSESTAARNALFCWYLATAAGAVEQAVPAMVRLPDTVPPAHPETGFDSAATALQWLDVERAELRALAADAVLDPDRPVWLLADTLRAYFFHQRHPDDWIAVAEAGARSARQAGRLRAEAAAELSSTQAYRGISRYDEAGRHADRALALAETADWPAVAGATWNELAVLQMERGNFRAAPELLLRAIDIYRGLGDTSAEASLRTNLGQAARQLGDLATAAEQFGRAIDLLPAEASVIRGLIHGSLGEIHRLMGRPEIARTELDQAQAELCETRQQLGLASSWASRSALEVDCGRLEAAYDAAEQALKLANAQQSDRLIAAALDARAEVRLAAGDGAAALDDASTAEQLAATSSSEFEHAHCLVTVARSLLVLGRCGPAADAATRAAAVADRFGYRIQAGDAEAVLAEIQLRLGRRDRARNSARRAVTLHRLSGHLPGERRAEQMMAGLG